MASRSISCLSMTAPLILPDGLLVGSDALLILTFTLVDTMAMDREVFVHICLLDDGGGR